MTAPKSSPHDTAKFSVKEILARLEEGRVFVRRTEDGSTLETAHAAAPVQDRRQNRGGGPRTERRWAWSHRLSLVTDVHTVMAT